MERLSPYAEQLCGSAKERYKEKISQIGGLDPFLGPLGECVDSVPPVEASDLVSYLVLQTSFVTAKQFKAYKGLESYNQFVCGWVKEFRTWKKGEKYLITGRVRHSQRFNDTPLSCWIITEGNGEICCAHCNCMAGLGETCTHVAAILFYLEALYRLQGNETCTQRKCEWIMPKFKKNMDYLPVKCIDFTSAKGKKKKLDEAIEGSTMLDCLECDSGSACKISLCSAEDLDIFYNSLSHSGTKPAILSLIPEHSSSYVPKHSLPEFPQSLLLLYDPNFLKLSYPELLQKCESVNIDVTQKMAISVEKESRQQYKSKIWFKYRSGRITASKMKLACHTDAANPSQSLIKQICYPESFVFHSKQTDWGHAREGSARSRYDIKMKELHSDFDVCDSGLIINTQWPYIGATPDGRVSCTCCGKGIMEIKCPYSHKENTIEQALADNKFCLKKDSNGKLYLDPTHAYYYQVQTQLFVADVNYCDFCVCTFTHSQENDLYIERIGKDIQFWTDCITKASHFFKTCILPELLGKWYTRSNKIYAIAFDSATSNTACSEPNSKQLYYCYCKGPEEGEMIACDNTDCQIEWFHLDCLKIHSVPKGKWYCPDCRKLPQFIKRKNKKQ